MAIRKYHNYWERSMAAIAWVSLALQYFLLLKNTQVGEIEATVRFLSYFTILTNTIVALYFTVKITQSPAWLKGLLEKPGALTAIAVYITIVALVYNVLLRHTWHPQGLQMVVDECLHLIIPAAVLFYWAKHEKHIELAYGMILHWLIYPAVYIIYILARGAYSGFYPYPFLDVVKLGYPQVFTTISGLALIFILLPVVFIFLGKNVLRKVGGVK